MSPNLTLNMDKNKYELSGDISENLESTIRFYNEFDKVNGAV